MSAVPADPLRDTRSRILEVFSGLLAGSGYLGVSLDAVAAETGIRKASLYHHFPAGKEEMYQAAALAYIGHGSAQVAQALAGATSLEGRLVELALLHTDPDSGGPELDQQVYDATRHVSDETRTVVSTAYMQGMIGPVAGLMQQATQSGELVGDPDFLAWSFLHLAQGVAPLPDDVAMPPEHRGPSPDVRSRAEAVVRLFLDGARAR